MNESIILPLEEDVTGVVLVINCVISALIALVAIPANCIIIVIYVRFKRLRDMNNTAITMLAITDFLRSCVLMPIKIQSQARFTSTLIEPFCAITALISAISFVFSPMVLALIAVIRCWTILPKFRQCGELTRRKFYIISVVMLTVAILFSILPYLDCNIGIYGYSEAHGVCFTNWQLKNKIYRTIFYTLVMKISLPVLLISYTLLFVSLHRRNKRFATRYAIKRKKNIPLVDEDIQQTTGKQYNGGTIEISILASSSAVASGTPEESTEDNKTKENKYLTGKEKEIDVDEVAVIYKRQINRIPTFRKIGFFKKMSKHEYHLTKVLFIIVIAYIVCWLPATIANYMRMKEAYVPKIWLYFIVTFIELKSCLDPLIYGLGNKRYRTACKRLNKDLRNWFSSQLQKGTMVVSRRIHR